MATTKNYYNYTKREEAVNPHYEKTHMFKVPFRMVIVAGSGAGKTNTALNILENMGGTFTKVHLCIASPSEPLYDLLKDKLKDKLEIYTGEIPVGGRSRLTQPNVPTLDSIAEEDNEGWVPQLVIFDDLCLYERQPRIEQYYIRGRKKGISMMYLSQSWFKVPPTVRRQCNYTILKRNVTESDLKRIKNQMSMDVSVKDFCRMYRDCTKSMQDFMFCDMEGGKIYKNFELTPIFENYKDNEYKSEDPPFNDDIKENYNWKDYKETTMKELGWEAFVKALRQHCPNTIIPYTDLYNMYVEFCRNNNYTDTNQAWFKGKIKYTFPYQKINMRSHYFIQ